MRRETGGAFLVRGWYLARSVTGTTPDRFLRRNPILGISFLVELADYHKRANGFCARFGMTFREHFFPAVPSPEGRPERKGPGQDLPVMLLAESELLRNELARQRDSMQRVEKDLAALQQKSAAEILASLNSVRGEVGALNKELIAQRQVGEEVLSRVLRPLAQQAREYMEQGILCLEAGETAMARERFRRALDADPGLSMGWQYLGLLAAGDNNAGEAIRYFERAARFADDDAERSSAFSRLARALHADEEPGQALNAAWAAAEAASSGKQNLAWYETARYAAQARRPKAMESALRRAIERDYRNWTRAAFDRHFDLARPQVEALLENIIQEEREAAIRMMSALEEAALHLEDAGELTKAVEIRQSLEALRERSGQDSIAEFRRIRTQAQARIAEAAAAADELCQSRMEVLDSELLKLEQWRAELDRQNQRQEEAPNGTKNSKVNPFLYAASSLVISAASLYFFPAPILQALGVVVGCLLPGLFLWLARMAAAPAMPSPSREEQETLLKAQIRQAETRRAQLKDDLLRLDKARTGLQTLLAATR
jgi:Tfp pilus assembly protein PilF